MTTAELNTFKELNAKDILTFEHPIFEFLKDTNFKEIPEFYGSSDKEIDDIEDEILFLDPAIYLIENEHIGINNQLCICHTEIEELSFSRYRIHLKRYNEKIIWKSILKSILGGNMVNYRSGKPVVETKHGFDSINHENIFDYMNQLIPSLEEGTIIYTSRRINNLILADIKISELLNGRNITIQPISHIKKDYIIAIPKNAIAIQIKNFIYDTWYDYRLDAILLHISYNIRIGIDMFKTIIIND